MKNKRKFLRNILRVFVSLIIGLSVFKNIRVYGEAIKNKRKFKIEVNNNCTACGGCIAVCHTLAIKNIYPKLLIDKNKCTFCGYCEQVCPVKGIKIYVKKS